MYAACVRTFAPAPPANGRKSFVAMGYPYQVVRAIKSGLPSLEGW